MITNLLKEYNVILASKSPRRQSLLEELGIDFTILTKEVDESFPENLTKEEIVTYLSQKKAAAFKNEIKDNDILITADTIVYQQNKVLNKPANYQEAKKMLKKLSGNSHWVSTGVSITNKNKQTSFCSNTKVFFKSLTDEEIDFYINNYKPFDKAGAYGIQEWIGFIGIEKIEGSYFNVVGLPVQNLYIELLRFVD